MNDPLIHLRYHDGVESLIGRERYRYEVVRQSEVSGMVQYLRSKGFDNFCSRLMGSLDLLRPICNQCDGVMHLAGSLEVCSSCGINRVRDGWRETLKR